MGAAIQYEDIWQQGTISPCETFHQRACGKCYGRGPEWFRVCYQNCAWIFRVLIWQMKYEKKNFYIWKFLPRKKSFAFAETCCTTLPSHLVDHPFCRSLIKNVLVVVLGLGSLAFFAVTKPSFKARCNCEPSCCYWHKHWSCRRHFFLERMFLLNYTVHFGETSELKQFKTACIGCVMYLVLPFNSNRKPQAVLTWLNRSQRIKSNWSSLSVLRLFQLCTHVKAFCASQLLLEDTLHK